MHSKLPGRHWFFMWAAAWALCACQTTPNPGQHARVEVRDVPRHRSELHTSQQVEQALEVYETEIRQQRLVEVVCVVPDAGAFQAMRQWNAKVLLPQRGTVHEGDTIGIRKIDNGPLTDKVYAYLATEAEVPPQAFHSYTAQGNPSPQKALLCDPDAGGVPRRVSVRRPVPAFELDYAKAERARHAQFSDADFAEGRVGLGQCSLRDVLGEVYYQPLWLFRIPSGVSVQKGDVVDIALGEPESGGGVGRVSHMIQALGTRDTFPHERYTAIYCH